MVGGTIARGFVLRFECTCPDGFFKTFSAAVGLQNASLQLSYHHNFSIADSIYCPIKDIPSSDGQLTHYLVRYCGSERVGCCGGLRDPGFVSQLYLRANEICVRTKAFRQSYLYCQCYLSGGRDTSEAL